MCAAEMLLHVHRNGRLKSSLLSSVLFSAYPGVLDFIINETELNVYIYSILYLKYDGVDQFNIFRKKGPLMVPANVILRVFFVGIRVFILQSMVVCDL